MSFLERHETRHPSPLAHCATVAAGAIATLVKATRRHFEPHLQGPVDSEAGARPPVTDASNASERCNGNRPVDVLADILRCETAELTLLMDHLYTMVDLARYQSELSDETFVRLDDLRWLLANYVINGGRIRRLMRLPELLTSIEDLATDPSLSVCRDITDLRSAAEDLFTRIRSTNAVTASWLIDHRVALPDPDMLDTNALLDRYGRLEIEPHTVSGDPLYLLTCHIHDMLETAESFGDLEHPVLENFEARLAAPLTAIHSELAAASTFNTALASAVRTVSVA